MDEDSPVAVGISVKSHGGIFEFVGFRVGRKVGELVDATSSIVGESVDSDVVPTDGAAVPTSSVDPADG